MSRELLHKIMPGIKNFRGYKKEWLIKDMAAGFSVAALTLPFAVAYAGIVGFPPEVGLYSAILPMAVFGLFSTSKHLIVGPDSATCMVVATVLAPFAAMGAGVHYEACILLSLMAGVICIIGGIFRLGFIANFLSKPILTGYLNGVALSLILTQIGRIFGYRIIDGGFFKVLFNFLSRLSETNYVILTIGLSALVLILICKKISPKIPAPLIAAVGGAAAVYFLGLQKYGVYVLGQVPSGLPSLGIPHFDYVEFTQLLPGALSLVLISYCSGMLTAKSFAMKSGDKIDANREFIAFGTANITSGISGGFVISGADSRTAVTLSMGGKTPLTAIIAAFALVIVMIFFTAPLAYLPNAALAAIVIIAAFGLFDIAYLKKLYTVSKKEFLLSVFTSFAVMTIGVLEGVLIAIGLALVDLIARASKPADAILGKVVDKEGYQDIDIIETEETPGILIYRFESSLIFFNVDYFRSRIKELIACCETKPEWLLLDAGSINFMDITGNDAVEDLIDELHSMGIKVAVARSKKSFSSMIKKSGVYEKIGEEYFYLRVKDGVNAYKNGKNSKTTESSIELIKN